MATGAQVWSTTAGSNNSIDSAVNWAEGQAPSSVNDSARGMMASVASYIGDNSGVLATTGSSTAFTVTSKQVSTGVVDGYTIAARFHATNTAGGHPQRGRSGRQGHSDLFRHQYPGWRDSGRQRSSPYL